jgi:hypothetical protein
MPNFPLLRSRAMIDQVTASSLRSHSCTPQKTGHHCARRIRALAQWMALHAMG